MDTDIDITTYETRRAKAAWTREVERYQRVGGERYLDLRGAVDGLQIAALGVTDVMIAALTYVYVTEPRHITDAIAWAERATEVLFEQSDAIEQTAREIRTEYRRLMTQWLAPTAPMAH